MSKATPTAQTQLSFWLIALAVFLGVVWLLRPMLLPFVAGLAIAYFLNPLVQALRRFGVSRVLGATIIILLAIVTAVAVVLLLLPLIQSQALALADAIPTYQTIIRERFMPWLLHLAERLSPEDVERLRTAAGAHVGDAIQWGGQLLRRVLSGGLAIFDILTLVFITPLVAFYVLRDWEILTSTLDKTLPRRHYAVIHAQLQQIDQTLAGFVRGQAMVCLILAAFYASGLSIVGLEFGAAIGVAAGLLSFIPYVGTTLGWMTSLALGAVQFSGWEPLAGIIAVFAIGQIAEGYFLTPKLVGDRVGLHPVWILFGLLAGASLFGFLGMMIAVPVSAVIGVLTRFMIKRYQASAYYQDHPPA
jgi:predicted PurR-regulated permease PerM